MGTKDLFSAEDLRDCGMEQVLENAGEQFRLSAYGFIKNLPAGWTGTGEDIRLQSELTAHHQNAWGAIINHAVRSNWLVHTGQYRNMRSKTSHARETKVYARTEEQSEA